MAVCGIVAEYNPFHNGHAYHIAQSRALLGADSAVVCAMSGNFVQRGSPAVFLKHARAEAAVRCGADLVLELPLPWALSSAEHFAFGAAALLASTGLVTHLSFGSERGDLAALRRVSDLLTRSEIDPLIREALGRGLPYAAARQAAAEALSGECLDIMSTPNNILGIEYLKALHTLRAPITPLTIPRRGAPHDAADGTKTGENPSASALRERLKTGGDVSGAVPAAALEIYRRETAAGRGPVFPETLDAALLSRLRALPKEAFAALPDMSEGLENRLFEAARESSSFAEAVTLVKTKRYAASRLRRAFLGAALGIRKEDAAAAPPYLRVLAANARGRTLLAKMRETAGLPVVAKPAAVRTLDARAKRVFALEAGATDLYTLALPAAEERRGGAEWRMGPVIVE